MAAGTVAAATRTLPRDVVNFTGRIAEFRKLTDAVAGQGSPGGICAIGGMAGVGKTALAIHMAHELAPQFPDGQIYLLLHGHTPGKQPVDPADALASLLLTAGVAAAQIPPGLEARSSLWRDHLAGMRLLLVLDDAAGHEQIRPLLPGTAGSLVLVTSRRHLTALEDTVAISLDTLPPDDASELLIKLAARQDMDPADSSVKEITRLCGYLPLAVGMLARQLHHHPAWSCSRLAADLAATRDRLAFMHAENLSVAAAFDLSYQDLDAAQQRMFRRLGLHPGTDIDAYSAAALDNSDPATASQRLQALYDQHLVTEPTYGRYGLHDLLREHSRSLAAQDPATDNEHALARLLDYYLHTVIAASAHLSRKSPGNAPAAWEVTPAGAPGLLTYADAVTWLDTERLSLHAAASQASPEARHAFTIATAMHAFLRNQGHWDQAHNLHQFALQAARDAGDRAAEAVALTDLGEIQQLTGEYSLAAASLTEALEIFRLLGDQLGQACALNELGVVQLAVNDHPAATASHEQALRLYRDLGNRAGEASALNELGLVQRAMGDYGAALASHELALRLYREAGSLIGEASALNRLAQMQRSTGNYQAAAANHERALTLHRDQGNRIGESTALYGLGILRQASGDYQGAISSHERALQLYRSLGYRFGQATALNGLGTAQLAAGDQVAAAQSYALALALNRDLGNRTGQVAALNGLGAALRAAGNYQGAIASLTQALRLCHDTGHKPGEAEAHYWLGLVQLAVGDQSSAAVSLRQALELYRAVGSRSGEAEALNAIGELLLASADYARAMAHHHEALEIASSISLRAEQARALEGIDRCHARA